MEERYLFKAKEKKNPQLHNCTFSSLSRMQQDIFALATENHMDYSVCSSMPVHCTAFQKLL